MPPKNYFENIKHHDGRAIKTRGVPFRKNSSAKTPPGSGFYSVVIPTYNRERGLDTALANVVNQTINPKQYEIIVIDDGSTDTTRKRVLEIQQRFPEHTVRYFHQQNGGPAKARNKGIKEAKGEIIFFTDDDCEVPGDWMETLLDGLNRYPTAAGVGGWHVPPPIDLKKSGASRYMHMVSDGPHPTIGTYIKDHEIVSNDPLVYFGIFAYNTANICYRKKILERVKGFREDFHWPGSEDNDLGFRVALAGYHLLYLPFNVTHRKNLDLFNFVKLHFHRGANGYLLRELNRKALEGLKPGFTGQFGSIANFAHRLSGTHKFWAFVEWASVNAGILYMHKKLEKGVMARKTGIAEHLQEYPVLPEPKR